MCLLLCSQSYGWWGNDKSVRKGQFMGCVKFVGIENFRYPVFLTPLVMAGQGSHRRSSTPVLRERGSSKEWKLTFSKLTLLNPLLVRQWNVQSKGLVRPLVPLFTRCSLHWDSYLIPLDFGFLICKTGIPLAASRGWYALEELMKYLAQRFGREKHAKC